MDQNEQCCWKKYFSAEKPVRYNKRYMRIIDFEGKTKTLIDLEEVAAIVEAIEGWEQVFLKGGNSFFIKQNVEDCMRFWNEYIDSKEI